MVRKLQYQAIARAIFVPVVIVPPPTGGVFTTFSQPAPKTTAVPAHQQPQPSFAIGRGPANTPTDRLVFSKFEGVPPPTSRLPAHQQPSPQFRILRPDSATPGPLVFTTFSQPRFSQVSQSIETASALFEVKFPPQQTLVFATFSQPRFSTTYRVVEQPSPLFEVARPDRGSLVFTTFSQPRFSTAVAAHFQPQPWQQFGPPIFPVPGGSSKKIVFDDPPKHRKTGLEPVRKRPSRKHAYVERPLPLPPFKPAPGRPRLDLEPVDLVDHKPAPGSMLELQAQIQTAEDLSDVEKFLTHLQQDEQDAADIADVLAMLEDED